VHDPLLAELYAHPDDPAPYLVYGDVLQARGDPRGELIALQSTGRDAAQFLAAHPELAPPPSPGWPFPTDAPLPADDIEWFCGFVKSMRATRFFIADVEALLAHPSLRLLRALSISGSGGVDGRVCRLAATHVARTLESIDLHLSGGDVFDGAYAALAPCTRLRSIHMGGDTEDSATIAALRSLHAFPQLRSLSVPVTLTDEACAALVGLPLESLFVPYAAATETGIAALATLPLVDIDVDSSIAPALAPLAYHPTLRRLVLSPAHGPTQLARAIAAALATLPVLDTLHLGDSTITDDVIAELAPLAPRLRSFSVWNAPLTSAACTVLARMTRLDHLSLPTNAAGLRALAPLSALECLLATSMAIDDAAIRELRPFHNLARLSLGGPNGITDACIEHLAALPKLRLLNLTRTAITPAGIDRLAQIPTLEAVFVNACDPATIVRAKQIAHWTVGDSVEGFEDER